MQDFKLFSSYFGPIAEDGDGTRVYGFENITQSRPRNSVQIPGDGGCFGYVGWGVIEITEGDKKFTVPSGCWFSTPGAANISFHSARWRVAVWQKENYRGTMSMGMVEKEGRLKYIDGCRDSILHAPIMKGEPCLNALFMPEGVLQTEHTHPSTRSGFIITGGAICETPDSSYPLEEGHIFFLPKDAPHYFRSNHGENITMKLVAYHPDSDYGPTDEEHPMLNRTIVDGVSARHLESIRTQ